MLPHFSLLQFLFSLAVLAILYYALLALSWKRKLSPLGARKSGARVMAAAATMSDEHLPPLIDRPAPDSFDPPFEHVSGSRATDDWLEEEGLDIVETEDTALLKEAESAVELIQDAIAGIASRPANPEEVFTKIRHIISHYGLFRHTEYYEAINNFIVVTVQRECEINFTAQDIEALWTEVAA